MQSAAWIFQQEPRAGVKTRPPALVRMGKGLGPSAAFRRSCFNCRTVNSLSSFSCVDYRKTSRSATDRTRLRTTKKTAGPTITIQKVIGTKFKDRHLEA